MNYSYLRNPPRLVDKLGFGGSPLPDAATERRFLNRLHTCAAEDLLDMTMVVGGFRDGLMAHAYAICRDFPPEMRAVQDIFYREHPEGAAVRELVELYRHRGRKVTLIGHSWGADAAVHAVARKTAATVDLLVTLDPVSRKRAPTASLGNVRRWVNVHLRYAEAEPWNWSNIVARIGGPWEEVPVAHVNIPSPVEMPHCDAAGLLRQAHERGLVSLQ